MFSEKIDCFVRINHLKVSLEIYFSISQPTFGGTRISRPRSYRETTPIACDIFGADYAMSTLCKPQGYSLHSSSSPQKSLDFLGTPYMLELWLGRSIIISCWSRREPINSQVLYLNVYRSLKRGLGAFDTTLVQQRNVAEILIFNCQVSDRGMGNYTSIYIKSLFMMFL